MSYKALYRKYRSQTFDELVGQDSIVTTLKNALATKKIAHAYLFSGPRGTGKTSIARLFAKALNCSEQIGHQCNTCENCIQISEGTHPDVIEIDAASNSGVDEVRSLIEKVKYSPIKGRYKIYIIDEVHMMTNSAFNALLKTLEEPPEYVIFILCTTEPYKLLPTILSRCQRFEFKKINTKALFSLVQTVLKNENCNADENAIKLIVELANGGARDALSILDQLIAYSGNNITTKNIESVFGLASKEEKMNILQLIAKKDANQLLRFLDLLLSRNIDILRLNNELLDLLKDTLVYAKTKSIDLIYSINENDAKQVLSYLNEQKIISIIEELLKCQNEFKTTSNPGFLFQIYLLKLVDIKSDFQTKPNQPILSTSTIAKAIKIEEEKPIIDTNVNGSITKKEVESLPPIFEDKKDKISEEEKSPLASSGEQYSINRDILLKIMVTGSKKAKEATMERWKYLDLYKNDKDLGPFAMLLKDGLPYIVNPEIILVSFNYDRDASRCNIKENQASLQKILKNILHRKFFIYGLNRKVITELTQQYLNLKQVNKLPKIEDASEIKIEK